MWCQVNKKGGQSEASPDLPFFGVVIVFWGQESCVVVRIIGAIQDEAYSVTQKSLETIWASTMTKK